MAVCSFVSGVIDQHFFPGILFPPSAYGFMLVGAILIFLWYRADAEAHAFRRSRCLDVLVFAIALLGLTYYFFRTRGFWKGLLACVLFVIAVLSSGLLTAAGANAYLFLFQAD